MLRKGSVSAAGGCLDPPISDLGGEQRTMRCRPPTSGTVKPSDYSTLGAWRMDGSENTDPYLQPSVGTRFSSVSRSQVA